MKRSRIEVGAYKQVFKGRRYTIEQASATLASGKRLTFERAIAPDVAIILAIDARKRLLLTREYRPFHGKTYWWLPAGIVDSDEDHLRAAQRELQEETGMRARSIKKFFTFLTPTGIQRDMNAYIAKDLVSDPLPHDEGEEIKVYPTGIPAAFKMVLEGKIPDADIAYAIVRLYDLWKKGKV